MPFDDGLGQGGFKDVREILWLTLIIIGTIALYKFCKNNKIKGKDNGYKKYYNNHFIYNSQYSNNTSYSYKKRT